MLFLGEPDESNSVFVGGVGAGDFSRTGPGPGGEFPDALSVSRATAPSSARRGNERDLHSPGRAGGVAQGPDGTRIKTTRARGPSARGASAGRGRPGPTHRRPRVEDFPSHRAEGF